MYYSKLGSISWLDHLVSHDEDGSSRWLTPQAIEDKFKITVQPMRYNNLLHAIQEVGKENCKLQKIWQN